MKGNHVFLLVAMVFIAGEAIADAGFSFRRRRPPTQITFEGTGTLGTHTFLLSYPSGRDTINDSDKFIVEDGGRNWDESERDLHFVLADASGRIVDSFTVRMKKYNYHMVISGVKNSKLQYTKKRTKAYFNYAVISEDESDGNNRSSRLVFIACSMLGFVLLIFIFLKRRKLKFA